MEECHFHKPSYISSYKNKSFCRLKTNKNRIYKF